jgi:F-type H+-transporting ATPase subunit b
MLQDPKFWLAVSFVIFAYFIFKLVLPKIILALKNKRDEISNKFQEIEDLRNRTEKYLAEAELIHKNIKQEAKKIIDEANNEANNIINRAENELKLEIKNKIKTAEEKIEQEKEKIIRSTKMSIISLAIEEIKKTFEEERSSKKIEEESILHVSKAIN